MNDPNENTSTEMQDDALDNLPPLKPGDYPPMTDIDEPEYVTLKDYNDLMYECVESARRYDRLVDEMMCMDAYIDWTGQRKYYNLFKDAYLSNGESVDKYDDDAT